MADHCAAFAAHTHLSAVRHIAQAKHPFVLIFWFVSFVILAGVTSYQVLGLVQLLNSNDALTLVSVIMSAVIIVHRALCFENFLFQIKTYPTKPFPAVTICSLNPYRKSALQDISDFTTLVSLYRFVMFSLPDQLFLTQLNLLDNIQKKQTRAKRQTELKLTKEKSSVNHRRQKRLLNGNQF